MGFPESAREYFDGKERHSADEELDARADLRRHACDLIRQANESYEHGDDGQADTLTNLAMAELELAKTIG